MRTASLYYLLKRGGSIYCPNHTFPRTNLQRKRLTGAVRSPEHVETCEKWVADFNAHKLRVGTKIYWLHMAAEQALKGKMIINSFYDGFVTWPTADELIQETIEEATDRLKDKYGRHFQKDDDDDENASESDSDGEINVMLATEQEQREQDSAVVCCCVCACVSE